MNTRWRRRCARLCGGNSARPSICLKMPCWPAQPRCGKSASGAIKTIGLPDLLVYHLSCPLLARPVSHGQNGRIRSPCTLQEPVRPKSAFPKQPYTRDELHTYLKHLRKKCQSTITALSDEKGHQPFYFPWDREHPISYFELQLYTMRHVQEHAAQLSLFLGQHGIPDEALDWVGRAKGDPDS